MSASLSRSSSARAPAPSPSTRAVIEHTRTCRRAQKAATRGPRRTSDRVVRPNPTRGPQNRLKSSFPESSRRALLQVGIQGRRGLGAGASRKTRGVAAAMSKDRRSCGMMTAASRKTLGVLRRVLKRTRGVLRRRQGRAETTPEGGGASSGDRVVHRPSAAIPPRASGGRRRSPFGLALRTSTARVRLLLGGSRRTRDVRSLPRAVPARPGRGDRVAREGGRCTPPGGGRRTAARPSPPARREFVILPSAEWTNAAPPSRGGVSMQTAGPQTDDKQRHYGRPTSANLFEQVGTTPEVRYADPVVVLDRPHLSPISTNSSSAAPPSCRRRVECEQVN
ncbi:hypothetical protein THAOC_20263 [Thalassiosira oceanica]|uniref:Uncharacterized protein n=1 Tax=Thalassiosira oceanica TaxID=159749 RepID=K0S071_THAOC|nr:hypothetical protein THAOC_20263 [Thalassiosira oceanica]|eukprot:EJK59503.1 hypothetical protein THAOC_20263 [Thalassiosira oceanica]